MDLKSAVKGTNDYRSLLLDAAQADLQHRAGYKAGVLTEDDGLPVTHFWQRDLRFAWVVGSDDCERYIGEIMTIFVNTRLCSQCETQIDNWFYPTIRTYTLLQDGELCECCGNVQKDDIPF